MTTTAPIIAATLIVRNEARCIRRCLQSVDPWVDRMVVLDTGSTDDTVMIARDAGAEVYHLEWPDSFALARNHILGIANADWHLVIDADEWIAAGGDGLRSWCNGPRRLGRVRIDSEAEANDLRSRNWITRLLPSDVRFEGRVHEQVVSTLPRARTELLFGHDGYSETQLNNKRHRNTPLLLAELADHPDDAYVHYQLGKDADMRGDAAGACVHYGRALEMTESDASWRHELVICAILALSKADRKDEALALAEAGLTTWMNSPDIFFVLGNLLLDFAVADPVRAVTYWLPRAIDAWDRCITIGERPELEGSVVGRGSFLAAHNFRVVHSQLALLSA